MSSETFPASEEVLRRADSYDPSSQVALLYIHRKVPLKREQDCTLLYSHCLCVEPVEGTEVLFLPWLGGHPHWPSSESHDMGPRGLLVKFASAYKNVQSLNML